MNKHTPKIIQLYKNITIGLYLAVFFYNQCKKMAKYKPIVMFLAILLALM